MVGMHPHHTHRSAAISLLAIAALFSAASAADQLTQPTAAGVSAEYFATHIRPLLESRCLECHGVDAQEGGLRLDSLAALAAGGKSGPVIAPGSTDESVLLQAVLYGDESLRMPPTKKLSETEIGLLATWIAGGAPHPDGKIEVRGPPPLDLAKARSFWSLSPLRRPPLPPVAAANGAAAEMHPIDAFVECQLRERGLEPTALADRPTLIRRATYDLIGLPPTPDEIDAFIADTSPTAFATVVERLLNSPHYGEHWARHWLDVVRYADSNGLDENAAHANAWRYRDYVVQSLNADMPFNEFLREQLAGDLLIEPDTGEQRKADLMIATGFLAMGPKVLAERDRVKLAMDIIDEQIDTTGRAFLGLSLGCARCHDHKFDPVTQADYYALAGIFKSTKTMDNLSTTPTWHENPIAAAAEQDQHRTHQKLIDETKAAIEKLVAQTRETLPAATDPKAPSTDAAAGAAATQAAAAPSAEQDFPEAVKTRLASLRETQKELASSLPVLASAMGVTDDKPEDMRIHFRGSHLTLGRRVGRGVPVVLAIDGPLPMPAAGSGRRELADWIADPHHPLTARVIANRLWRWHYGRGIVPSTDNFGFAGAKPTNQPLLDWLAVELIDRGFSLKAMHRLIMASRTWQQSSDSTTSQTADRALTTDPDNALWWRADVRRLEAESIRDAILVASDTLDRTRGGSLLQVTNRALVFDHTSKDQTKYDSPRRSLYLPVIRNHINDALWLFDCTDGAVANGSRTTSTVASQALYLLNSDFLMQSADAIAKSLIAAAPHDNDARILLLFRRVLGRRPTAEDTASVNQALQGIESQLARENAAAGDRDILAWTVVSQALLAGNEFMLVR